MYNEPIFLQPVFKERIWGGQKLETEFDYPIPSDETGEAWVISAHPNGPSIIENGELAGKSLEYAWYEHGGLFNKRDDNNESYPLLVKILDAADHLSVQVHPDDTFAQEVEGTPYGKTECWYVLHAEEGAELIIGHNAKTKEELTQMMDDGEWDSLLRKKKVQKGDFVYVPSGTIHAIGKGIVILETQQSSDITYRVYDYDRVDANGQKRELHLQRAKDVTLIPHKDSGTKPIKRVIDDLVSVKLVEETYFTVYHWTLNGQVKQKLDCDFLQVSVIDGHADVSTNGKTFPVKKGTNFILPHGIDDYGISGNASFIVSHT
ncbi:MAG TPA: mannose-6-phosphate isomerase, class I [Virgibacillus sp.]|nr:mannose-6-phosphate isomerase, class I [Virgibacillus sp.]